MKKLKLTVNKKIVFEFISISFAVFLGLMMNQWKDNLNHRNLAEQSKKNILAEVIENERKVVDMLGMHHKTLLTVDSAILFPGRDYELDVSFSLLNTASWETARLTRAISYMDIEVVSELAGVYRFQEYYESIVKSYSEKFFFYQEDDEKSNKELKKFMKAIVGMETNLEKYYNQLQDEVLVAR
jgi:hypothetical protein